MSTLQILASAWAAGFAVSLPGLAWAVKPANADGWTIVLLMAVVWPLTLLTALAMLVLDGGDR